MTQENSDLVRRLVDTYNEFGIVAEETRSFFAEQAVFEEPPEQPGASIARGRDEVASAFSRFDDTWEEHRSEVEEVRVIDAERILLITMEHFRGRDGIEVATPAWTVFTLRDGRIARMQAFWERRNALDAAGLGE